MKNNVPPLWKTINPCRLLTTWNKLNQVLTHSGTFWFQLAIKFKSNLNIWPTITFYCPNFVLFGSYSALDLVLPSSDVWHVKTCCRSFQTCSWRPNSNRVQMATFSNGDELNGDSPQGKCHLKPTEIPHFEHRSFEKYISSARLQVPESII